MAIPESQLEKWSHQGAVTTSKRTADSIKGTLNYYEGWPEDIEFEVYLQGSYKNDTNIRGDSDVDVVIQLNSTFYSNLTDDQKRFLGLNPASYSWTNFKNDVLTALRDYYGYGEVTEGNKSIKLAANSSRLPADIVVCAQYRRYRPANYFHYTEGICFWTTQEGRQVINYPNIHYDNGVSKHQGSGQWYKPTVRLFKNARAYIQGDTTPSYFLECMLHNIPNSKFGTSYQETFCNVVNWLSTSNLAEFMCQNGQLRLFGGSQEQWSTTQAKGFVNSVISLWNTW